MVGRIGSRELRRLLGKAGIKIEELSTVEEVSIKTPAKLIRIKKPSVSVIEGAGGKFFQIYGGEIEEEVAIPDEDVRLVAQQAGTSLEEARQALEEAGGDLAKAILILSSKAASPAGRQRC